VQDAAAAVFTSAFYLALAVGRSVGAAFAIATEAVRASPRLQPGEAAKFRLFPTDGVHSEIVWPVGRRAAAPGGGSGEGGGAREARRLASAPASYGCLGMLAPVPLAVHSALAGAASADVRESASPLEFGELATSSLPMSPEDFLGRQLEMAQLCRALRTRRLAVVSAAASHAAEAAGVGKTTLAVAVGRYLAVRAVYGGGVALARCAGVRDARALSRALRMALHVDAHPDDEDSDAFGWLARVRTRHALVIVDGVDEATGDDGALAATAAGGAADCEGGALRALLEAVFARTERLELILTTRRPLGAWSALLPVKAVAVPLGALAPYDAARLFVRRTTRAISAAELDRLVRPAGAARASSGGGHELYWPAVRTDALPPSAGPGGLIEQLAAHALVTRCRGHPARLLRAAAAVTHDIVNLAELLGDDDADACIGIGAPPPLGASLAARILSGGIGEPARPTPASASAAGAAGYPV
jgi:hypothetical protein